MVKPKTTASTGAKAATVVRKKKAPSEPTLPPVPEASPFSVGDKVRHPQFGSGVIKNVEFKNLTIAFTAGRERVIFDTFVKLEGAGRASDATPDDD